MDGVIMHGNFTSTTIIYKRILRKGASLYLILPKTKDYFKTIIMVINYLKKSYCYLAGRGSYQAISSFIDDGFLFFIPY